MKYLKLFLKSVLKDWKSEREIGKRSSPDMFPHEGMSMMYEKVE